jgi:2-oxoisovalerate dehydrogenase E2 component (dihydrolipoyl transacylase)
MRARRTGHSRCPDDDARAALRGARRADPAGARRHIGSTGSQRGNVHCQYYGLFGVNGSAAIINYPEVAILGVGRIIERPWVVGGRVEPRKITQLALVFDHRVCDGGVAGGFLRLIADYVEVPGRAMRLYRART